MYLINHFPSVLQNFLKYCILFLILFGLGFLGYHIFKLSAFGLVVGPIIGDSGILKDAAENPRGDRVMAVTDASGGWNQPAKIDIRLRPSHSWFWSPLLKAESFGVHEDLIWRRDNILDIKLDFGCAVYVPHLVTMVGSIHILYHFTYNDKSLDLDLVRQGARGRPACQKAHPSG